MNAINARTRTIDLHALMKLHRGAEAASSSTENAV